MKTMFTEILEIDLFDKLRYNEEAYQCSYCGYTAANAESLHYHIITLKDHRSKDVHLIPQQSSEGDKKLVFIHNYYTVFHYFL